MASGMYEILTKLDAKPLVLISAAQEALIRALTRRGDKRLFRRSDCSILLCG
jgi:hypothetical protein